MYVDKLDGKIDRAFFDRMSADWRREQDDCLRQIERLRSADQSYLQDGIRILELAKNAQNLFEQQDPREKRRLPDFVLSNSTLKDGALGPTFKQPFDITPEMAMNSRRAKVAGMGDAVKSESWLPFLDTYRTVLLSQPQLQWPETSPGM